MLSDVQNALELLRASGTDTAGVEAKAARGGWPKSALSSLSAFANTTGGLLLLGVDEATDFAVVEIDAQLLADTLAAACREQIEPPLTAQIEIVSVEGGQVVAARIDEIPQDRKPARHDEEPVAGSSVSDFDPDIVRGYLNRLRTNKPSTFARLDDQQALLLVGALVEQPDGVASLGGLLAFGQYQQCWFPQLNLVVVAYPTSDHRPLSDGTRFLDNVSVDGPIPRMVEDGIAASDAISVVEHGSSRCCVRTSGTTPSRSSANAS